MYMESDLRLPPHGGIIKFGRLEEIDSGDTADVWDYGNVGQSQNYPWPSAAATTTVVSDDVNDTAAGTGARTVHVQGLDANYMELTQIVTMNGTTPVELGTDLIRVHRAWTGEAGAHANGNNVGNIDIKHGATIIGRITAGWGQTQMCLYTAPADKTMYICKWVTSAHFAGASAGNLHVRLDLRPFGGSWNNKGVVELGGQAGALYDRCFAVFMHVLEPKTDLRVRAFSPTDNNTEIAASVDLLWRNPVSHLE